MSDVSRTTPSFLWIGSAGHRQDLVNQTLGSEGMEKEGVVLKGKRHGRLPLLNSRQLLRIYSTLEPGELESVTSFIRRMLFLHSSMTSLMVYPVWNPERTE